MQVNQKRQILIYSLVFAIMVLWGINIVILKILVTELPPATMTAFRVMLAGITTMTILILSRSIRKMTGYEWKYMLLGMIFGVILHHALLAISLTMIDASSAALQLALVPLTTAIMAVIFLGEKLTPARTLGILIALTGVFFIQDGSFTSFTFSLGEILIFISMFTQALSFIFIRKVTMTLSPTQTTAMMFLTGSLGLVIVSFIVEPGGIKEMFSAEPYVYVLFVLSGIIVTGFGYMVYNSAIKEIGAGQTVIFNNFVPFFGVIFSMIFLNETITNAQIAGFVLVVIGVLFGTGYIEYTWRKRNKKNEF